jgi:mercuric ion transport protein
MPSPARRPRPGVDGPSGAGLTAAGIGAALLVIVCCAAPVVLAAGALATIGAWLANPWVIAAGAALLIAALTLAVRRRREGRDACHPPAGEEGPYRR